jgi:hypothetical protein
MQRRAMSQAKRQNLLPISAGMKRIAILLPLTSELSVILRDVGQLLANPLPARNRSQN